MKSLLAFCFILGTQSLIAQPATVTIYSTDGFATHAKQSLILEVGSGKEEFRGRIFQDGEKLADVVGARFLTFTVTPGKHIFTVGRKPDAEIAINAEPGKSYFVKAAETHKGAWAVQIFHWSFTSVGCEEARSEADTLKPLQIKKVGKAQRSDLVNAAYFPSCAKQ